MNTTNVMATNVTPNAKTNTNNQKAVTKNAKSNSKSKNFDDTLEKLNDEGKDTFVPKNVQGSNAASDDAGENNSEDPSDTPLAANIIAAEGAALSALVDTAAAVETLTAAADNAASELPLETVASDTKQQQTVNLQTLLPQSEAETAQNKNFLAMLSGQTLSKENSGGTITAAATQETVDTIAKPLDVSSPLALLNVNNANKGATVLEAQLNNSTNLPLNSVVAASSLTSEIASSNSNLENLASPAAIASVQPQAQVTANTLVAATANADTAENNVSDLIGDADLTVEDAEPLRVMSHGAADNAASNSFAEENSNGGEGEKALAKEVASLPSESETNNVETAAASRTESHISSFQQHLQENISAPKGTESVKTPDAPTDNFDIPKQIVEQARLIRRGEDTQMVIKLNPEHLGELTLKVSVTSNGSVNASFHSDNTAVRTIIENSLVQLKQELNDQGLKVENVDVYAALDSDLPQDQGQQAWQNNGGSGQKSSFRGSNVDAEGYELEADGLAPVGNSLEHNNVAGADGVDYRI